MLNLCLSFQKLKGKTFLNTTEPDKKPCFNISSQLIGDTKQLWGKKLVSFDQFQKYPYFGHVEPIFRYKINKNRNYYKKKYFLLVHKIKIALNKRIILNSIFDTNRKVYLLGFQGSICALRRQWPTFRGKDGGKRCVFGLL